MAIGGAKKRFGPSVLVLMTLLSGCAAPTSTGSTSQRAATSRSDCTCSHDGSRILFDTDSSLITADARAVIERMATFIHKYPAARFTIEGHADERGTRDYNLALGERRANALKAALLHLGVPDTQIAQVISYGMERPSVPGETEAAWAQNRRAVIVLIE